MSIFKRLFAGNNGNQALTPLYHAIVEMARQPHWYSEGLVPDSMDGRFDMIAALTALVLLRMERDDDARQESAYLAELFVEDMDGQLRQLGIGDIIVGKHIGRMMGALGGRLGAFREAIRKERSIESVVQRNIYREVPMDYDAVAHVKTQIEQIWDRLQQLEKRDILAGRIA